MADGGGWLPRVVVDLLSTLSPSTPPFAPLVFPSPLLSLSLSFSHVPSPSPLLSSLVYGELKREKEREEVRGRMGLCV